MGLLFYELLFQFLFPTFLLSDLSRSLQFDAVPCMIQSMLCKFCLLCCLLFCVNSSVLIAGTVRKSLSERS